MITVNTVYIIYIKAMQTACVKLKKKGWFLTNFPFLPESKNTRSFTD